MIQAGRSDGSSQEDGFEVAGRVSSERTKLFRSEVSGALSLVLLQIRSFSCRRLTSRAPRESVVSCIAGYSKLWLPNAGGAVSVVSAFNAAWFSRENQYFQTVLTGCDVGL